ncbi:MAG: hypothetical protein WCS20_11755, partial [Alphaproteobacteria bacterium]
AQEMMIFDMGASGRKDGMGAGPGKGGAWGDAEERVVPEITHHARRHSITNKICNILLIHRIKHVTYFI